MATYGSRDKNPFQPGGKLGTGKYYLLVEKDGINKGRITIKSPTAAGSIGGANADRTVGTIPLDNTFKPEPGSTTSSELEYFSSTNAQKAVKNQGIITAQKGGASEQEARQLIFPNTAASSGTPPPASPPPSATPPPDGGAADITPVPLENPNIAPDAQRINFGSDNNLRYPLKLNNENQDYIQFSMKSNEGRSLNTGGSGGIFKGLGERNAQTEIKGTVTLPIQSGITDSNGVEWGGANLDAKDAYLASLALGGITSSEGLGEAAGSLLGRVFNDIKQASQSGNDSFKNAINLYLAQEAVGVQGLLSRASGAILNPNLELLFNGPTLRSFNFTFKLSPRSKREAENVRRIIRFFKEGMSVKTAATGVFLKSPNLFTISYISSGGKKHISLPLLKQCALLGCDVDYTPDGTYMTFNDEAKTMTSYQLSLRFGEVEPIYSNDYKDLPLDQIGY
jgi:hypothetical protein